jgi:hypothetical protein
VAQNLIQILLEARDNASAKLALARAEVSKTRQALAGIAPTAAQALGPLSGVATAGLAFGPAAAAVAGVTLALGALVAGAKAAVDGLREMAAEAEQLQNFAEKTGVGVERLQIFQQAFKDAGVDVDTLRIGLRFLAKAINDNNPLLAALGITTRDAGEAFLQLSDILARTEDGTRKTGVALELLGARSGAELIPVMNKGAVAFSEVETRMRSMGQLIATDTIGKLDALDDQFDALANQVDGLKKQLVLLAAPALSDVVQKLSDAVAQVVLLKTAFGEAKSALEDFIDKTPILKQLDVIATVLKAIEKANEALKRSAGASIGDRGRTAAERLAEPIVPPVTGELPDIEAIKKAQAEAAKAAEKLKDQLRQVYDELRKIALSPADIDRLAQSFARSEITITSLLKKYRDVAFTLDIIERSKAFSDQSQVERAIRLADELRRALLFADRKPEQKGLEIVERRTFDRRLQGEIQAWSDEVKRITDEVNANVALMRGAFVGFASGLQQVFGNMLGSTQTFARAMKTIFHSMVNAILAELARLLAAKIFQFFLRLAGVPSISVSAPIIPIGETPISLGTAARPVAPGTLGASRGGDTYNIYGYDARSIVQDLTSPAGSLRRANDRLSIQGAF